MAIDFSKFKALTFDCYGTLIDWESGLVASLQPFLKTKGRDMEAEEILSLYAKFEPEAENGKFKSYKEVLRECMHAFSKELTFRLHGEEENLLARGIQNWQPFPDTVAALTELQKHYKMCIVSNVDKDLVAHSVRWLQVPFDAVVTAEDVGSYKPAQGHFLEAIRRLELPKSEILHVACSQYHDIAPARALGLKSVWVNRRRGQEGTGATPASTAKADLEVGSLKELVDLVLLP
jgi:2-haloacid dehalogenase